jgi:hypothetical protein
VVTCKEGADRGRAIPISAFRVSRDWKGRVGSLDSRTRELRVATRPLELGLGHSVVVARKVELVPSVVCTGELPKGPVDRLKLRFQQGIERADSAQRR